jgi:hypothetical protein
MRETPLSYHKTQATLVTDKDQDLQLPEILNSCYIKKAKSWAASHHLIKEIFTVAAYFLNKLSYLNK